MTSRELFCVLARAQLGKVVVWGAKGPAQFDCSELVAWGIAACGGPNMSDTHTAQRLHDETPALATFSTPIIPLAGDLVFHGLDVGRISHVSIWLADGQILSADGATSKVTDPVRARENPLARVRLHKSVKFRGDLPYLQIHRNTWLEAL